MNKKRKSQSQTTDEDKIIKRTATSLLILVTVVVELVLTLTLLGLNGIPAVLKGYWTFAWVFFIVWGIASFAWISVMAVFIRESKRKELVKRAQREFRSAW